MTATPKLASVSAVSGNGKDFNPATTHYVAASLADRVIHPETPLAMWRLRPLFGTSAPARVRILPLEHDLGLNFPDASEFTNEVEGSTLDLIVAWSEPSTPACAWHERMARLSQPVHRCLFPLVRISGRALDFLLDERRKLSQQFTGSDQLLPRTWPTDESCVATSLINAALTSTRETSTTGRASASTSLPATRNSTQAGPMGRSIIRAKGDELWREANLPR